MVGILIIVLALISAFAEKPHLFKKPFNREKIFLTVLILGTGIFSIVKEINDNEQKDTDSRTIASLRGETKILLTQVDTLRRENTQSKKEYEDSLVNYHLNTVKILAAHGLKIDTLTNTVKHFDVENRNELLPTLDIRTTPQFEKMYGKENIIFYLLSTSSAASFLLDYSYSVINIENDHIIGKPITIQGEYLNASTIIDVDNPIYMSWFIDRNQTKYKLNDEFVLAMEFFYKSKSEKPQPPLRKIYLVDTKQRTIKEVQNHDYKTIFNKLITDGTWHS